MYVCATLLKTQFANTILNHTHPLLVAMLPLTFGPPI